MKHIPQFPAEKHGTKTEHSKSRIEKPKITPKLDDIFGYFDKSIHIPDLEEENDSLDPLNIGMDKIEITSDSSIPAPTAVVNPKAPVSDAESFSLVENKAKFALLLRIFFCVMQFSCEN